MNTFLWTIAISSIICQMLTLKGTVKIKHAYKTQLALPHALGIIILGLYTSFAFFIWAAVKGIVPIIIMYGATFFIQLGASLFKPKDPDLYDIKTKKKQSEEPKKPQDPLEDLFRRS